MHCYSPRKTSYRPASIRQFRVDLSGSAQGILTTFVALFFLAGGLYLYSVNRSAVQGYEMRGLEKKIETLKKQNASLKVDEAERSSLTRVQSGSENLRMEKSTPTDTIILGNDTVALR